MKQDLSEWTTSDLLLKIRDSDDLAYSDALWTLIMRWRQGIDLEFLIGLLRSESSRDRAQGAFCLNEAGRPAQGDVPALDAAVIELADDVLSDCNRTFVKYVKFAGLYDETIANALARCLLDWNLSVRYEVIDWAIQAPEKTFESFSELVKSGSQARKPRFGRPDWNEFWRNSMEKRAIRALDIIQRARAGEVDRLSESIINEDNFVFDSILFSNMLSSRYTARESR